MFLAMIMQLQGQVQQFNSQSEQEYLKGYILANLKAIQLLSKEIPIPRWIKRIFHNVLQHVSKLYQQKDELVFTYED